MTEFEAFIIGYICAPGIFGIILVLGILIKNAFQKLFKKNRSK